MVAQEPVAEPGERERALRALIAQFLEAHTTLTLATVSDEGVPAAAALFYVHDPDLNLYFLSEEGTQHARNLAARPAAAATVQADGQDWRTLWGLQVRGVATPVAAGEQAHAVALYGRKYAFVTEARAGRQGPAALAGPLARARFYVLRPRWLRLINNRVRFGYKEALVLAQGDDG